MFRVALTIAVVIGLWVNGAQADDATEKDRLDSLHENVREGFQNLKSVNLDGLAISRQRYWDSYKKGGPEFLAAKTEFSHILFVRDIIALWLDPSAENDPDSRKRYADRMIASMLKSSTLTPAQDISESASPYFEKWNLRFHDAIFPEGAGNMLSTSSALLAATVFNSEAVVEAWNKAKDYYLAYQVARNWAEESMAPFPLPVEQYLFGLVLRWPYPASVDQAEADHQVLLKTFGSDRVIATARKVQSAMSKDGLVQDSAALGIPPESGRNNVYFMKNPYEVLWTLLTKDDPNLTRLRNIYRGRYSDVSSSLDDEIRIRSKFPLQSIVDEWQHPKANEILWVEDQPSGIAQFLGTLQKRGYKVLLVPSTTDAINRIAGNPSKFRIILSGMTRIENSQKNLNAGLDLLKTVRSLDQNIPFIIFCSKYDETANGVAFYSEKGTLITSDGSALGTKLIALAPVNP